MRRKRAVVLFRITVALSIQHTEKQLRKLTRRTQCRDRKRHYVKQWEETLGRAYNAGIVWDKAQHISSLLLPRVHCNTYLSTARPTMTGMSKNVPVDIDRSKNKYISTINNCSTGFK